MTAGEFLLAHYCRFATSCLGPPDEVDQLVYGQIEHTGCAVASRSATEDAAMSFQVRDPFILSTLAES